MIQALPIAPAIRFHLSLNVSDLDRAVLFYRTLFGLEPAKRRSDYAKFELDEPPLVLSLEPTARGAGGVLNHLGFRLPDVPALVALQERLERAGLHSQREEGVECCYARQTKFWIHDPDQTLWEIYTLDADLDHRGPGQSLETMRPPALDAALPTAVIWEHLMTQPLPASLPLADGTADEVRLRGTFNVPLADDVRSRLLDEALRVLKPGGKLFVHVLTGDRPAEAPQLPGPAALVQVVPLESSPARWLEEKGFTGVEMVKFETAPCFVRHGVQMRETQVVAWKPNAAAGATVVLYKGPFRQVVDDAGTVYRRGERVRTTAANAERLRHGATAACFTFLEVPAP